MKLIDIGANLANSQFNNDLEAVLHNASLKSLTHIILTTVDNKSLFDNLDICNKYQQIINLTTTWGLHPHNAKNLTDFRKTEEMLVSPYIVALGEFGLDYFRLLSTKVQQITAMEYFLAKAKETNLPLFLHERDAFEDFCSIYSNSKIDNKAVVHCFTGNKEQVKKYLDMGMFIGITGWLCDERRNLDVIEALRYIPIDRLMIETDSPYLKPRNIKQKNIRNEPAYLEVILDKVCEIKQEDKEHISNFIYENSVKFFNLPYLERKLKP